MWKINFLTHNSESSLLWRVNICSELCELPKFFYADETKAEIYVHESVLELLQNPWHILNNSNNRLKKAIYLSLCFPLSVFICPPLSVDPKCPADVDLNSPDMDIKTITSALKFYLRWVKHTRFYDVQKWLFFI